MTKHTRWFGAHLAACLVFYGAPTAAAQMLFDLPPSILLFFLFAYLGGFCWGVYARRVPRCGAERYQNINGLHIESSGWVE